MYHPYFRGKQFELITIREMAPLLAEKEFVPIIEPVREALGGMKKTLQAVCDAGGHAIVVVNPYHGDHQEDGTNLSWRKAGDHVTFCRVVSRPAPHGIDKLQLRSTW